MYKTGESGPGSRGGSARSHWRAALTALVATVVLTSCGSSTPTNTARKFVVIPLRSNGVHARELEATYTCDGKDVSPPLKWGAVPAGVEQLTLFALGVKALKSGRLLPRVEWALGGLKPSLHSLSAGEIPPGAFLMANSNGQKRYSVCPSKGKTGHYGFALYALPVDTRATPRLEGEELLFNLTGPNPRDRAPAGGAFVASYTRK
jgi:phosphatidylethanolamine-binding protein (PEBP) family uncharacterized protein